MPALTAKSSSASGVSSPALGASLVASLGTVLAFVRFDGGESPFAASRFTDTDAAPLRLPPLRRGAVSPSLPVDKAIASAWSEVDAPRARPPAPDKTAPAAPEYDAPAAPTLDAPAAPTLDAPAAPNIDAPAALRLDAPLAAPGSPISESTNSGLVYPGGGVAAGLPCTCSPTSALYFRHNNNNNIPADASQP